VIVRLHTLGNLDLRNTEGNEIRSLLAQPKRLALLVYLAASPAPFHRRDSLVATFWPDSDETSGRAALRTALSWLRRSLGDDAILSRGADEVGVDPQRLWCDVPEFERACAQSATERALALYGGELLPGFHVEGAPEFERWLEARRGELQRRAAAAAWVLANGTEEQGDRGAAVHWAHAAARLAPDDEPALRRLIELLDRVGDRAGALRAYDDFAVRLRDEFEAEPAPATQALIDAVRARSQATPAREPVLAGAARASDSLGQARRAVDPALETGDAVRPVSELQNPRPAAPSASRRRTIGQVAAAGAVVVLALTLVSLVFAPATGREFDARRVVVVPFENRTGDPALEPLGRMAADWITQGIAETGLVEVVTSTTMLAAWNYVSTEQEPTHAAAMYRALADETGAGTMVTGSFYRHTDSLRFQVAVIDVRDRQLLRTTEPVSGTLESPLEAVQELRARVMGVLATLFDQRLMRTTASASRPPTFESYRAYLDGTERFILGDYAGAIPHYLLAAALDPTFAHPRIFAAINLHNIGQIERADSVARTLEEARLRLSPFDRHLLDWLQAWIRGEPYAALEAIRRATELVPNSEWLYVHSLSAHQANRPAESVEVLRRLDPERGFMRGFVAYWADLTASLHALGHHGRELRDAQKARRRYPQDIIALRSEVRAFAALGRVLEVERLVEESLILPSKFGVDHITVMQVAAIELRAHGKVGDAARVLDRAVVWHRSRSPDEQRSERNRIGLGRTLYLAGRWEEARTVFTALAAEHPENLEVIGHLGAIAARLGDHAEARRIDELLAGLERPFLHGAHTAWRARIAAVLGEHERAVHLLRDSFSQGRPFGSTLHTDVEFEPLRGHPVYRELLRAKG
jgi:DNA-binding SARP family transcriptional activator/tetratricopeptide (TPR) repeat protein/TolB-like protein